MKESDELKSSRAAYLEKLVKFGAINIPASAHYTVPACAHYTAGYKDGSAILLEVAQTCAEAERRLEEITKQRDELLAAIDNVEKMKGRYHTEIAWRRLADLAKSIAAALKG